jgi:hypothetical protein
MVTDSILKQVTAKRALEHSLAFDSSLGPDGEPLDTSHITTLTGDSKVVVYFVPNGERREILRNDAVRALMKMQPNGEPYFWMEGMVGERPVRLVGSIRCWLHPEFSFEDSEFAVDRAWLESIGMRGRFCNRMAPEKKNRADFDTMFERNEHARIKHRREFESIMAAIARREVEQDRADRTEATSAILTLAGGRQSAPPIPAEVETVAPSVQEVTLSGAALLPSLTVDSGATFTPSPVENGIPCPVEGCEKVHRTEGILRNHIRLSKSPEHKALWAEMQG